MVTTPHPDLLELRRLVIDMAEELDDVRASGRRTPYSGDELRTYFRALARSEGIEAALAEARRRYDDQLHDRLRPLPVLKDA